MTIIDDTKEQAKPDRPVIVIDTREQTPLPFKPSPAYTTTRGTLHQGDYSIQGYEGGVAIERKSVEDLIGTLWGHTRAADGTRRKNLDRFAAELSRLSSYPFRYVAITGSLLRGAQYVDYRRTELERRGYRWPVTWAATVGLIQSLEARFKILFVFFPDAQQCADWVAGEFVHFWRFQRGESRLKLAIETS